MDKGVCARARWEEGTGRSGVVCVTFASLIASKFEMSAAHASFAAGVSSGAGEYELQRKSVASLCLAPPVVRKP
jgi:hypothetical protein